MRSNAVIGAFFLTLAVCRRLNIVPLYSLSQVYMMGTPMPALASHQMVLAAARASVAFVQLDRTADARALTHSALALASCIVDHETARCARSASALPDFLPPLVACVELYHAASLVGEDDAERLSFAQTALETARQTLDIAREHDVPSSLLVPLRQLCDHVLHPLELVLNGHAVEALRCFSHAVCDALFVLAPLVNGAVHCKVVSVQSFVGHLHRLRGYVRLFERAGWEDELHAALAYYHTVLQLLAIVALRITAAASPADPLRSTWEAVQVTMVRHKTAAACALLSCSGRDETTSRAYHQLLQLMTVQSAGRGWSLPPVVRLTREVGATGACWSSPSLTRGAVEVSDLHSERRRRVCHGVRLARAFAR